MKQLLLSVAAITALGLSTPTRAQGVPTFDGSQLGQLVAQLEHMAEDLNVQLQQLATMRLELETQLSQLLNLDAQLTSLVEGSWLRPLHTEGEAQRRGAGAALFVSRGMAHLLFLVGQGKKIGDNLCGWGDSCDQHYRATQHIWGSPWPRR